VTQKQKVCPGCHGVVTGTHKFTFEESWKNHLASCPSRALIKEKE